ncbi:ferrous iron transporter B [Xanthomonas sp. AmX2]|uniref:FimV/HubP family polar landmark protein n=1 Tax=Xanthomonas sp. TaxID=29446 RepID=UPI00197DE196|nr:ferrous iron transporter B [Xanthomonas sp.]
MLLLACSQAALALGLGDLRVLSKPGQPFLAEIPVISNEPGELENARVALASPATFARVGLERPQGLVGDLQFQFAQDSRGRAVIRVTSQQPVQVPSLSFLIEVDWGQGRLIREYSALVDAPNTAAAIAEPAIDAPAAAASNAIAPAAPIPAPAEERPAPVAMPAPATPAPRPAPIAPTPAPAAGDTLAPVQRGQTLSHIAAQLARGSGQSLDQTMVALLRANPDAFIRGNLNLLKQGAVLRTPQQDALAQIDAAEAAAIVREQTAQWRQARAPVPQPAQAQTAAADAGAAPPRAAAAPSGGARLEIAPAVAADGRNAGTKSGTGAGDEGDMVANQQLQQTREDLAARDAEVQELRARVEELEKLKAQQQQLIALKDSDLAAAQKRLAQTQAPAPAPAGESGGWPLWLWGGLALLLLGIGAWLLSRRRKPSPLPPLSRGGYDTAALAAAVPVTAHRDVDAPDLPSLDEREDSVHDREDAYEDEASYEQARDADRFQAHLDPHTAPAPAFDEEADEPWRQPALIDPPPPEPAPPAPATLPPAWQEPAWHPADASDVDAADAPAAPAPSAGRERLELAVAYMDLGDNETARTLLTEVATGGDPAARAEALQLLARLG